jgi:hypothetical protein
MPIQIRRAAVNNLIEDLTNGSLDEIKEFAEKNNLIEKFNKAFSNFEIWSKDGFVVKLYPDFAPYSLEFCIYTDGKFYMNGGFILHGFHDGFGSGSAPTFSVELDPDTSGPYWSIHT